MKWAKSSYTYSIITISSNFESFHRRPNKSLILRQTGSNLIIFQKCHSHALIFNVAIFRRIEDADLWIIFSRILNIEKSLNQNWNPKCILLITLFIMPQIEHKNKIKGLSVLSGSDLVQDQENIRFGSCIRWKKKKQKTNTDLMMKYQSLAQNWRLIGAKQGHS